MRRAPSTSLGCAGAAQTGARREPVSARMGDEPARSHGMQLLLRFLLFVAASLGWIGLAWAQAADPSATHLAATNRRLRAAPLSARPSCAGSARAACAEGRVRGPGPALESRGRGGRRRPARSLRRRRLQVPFDLARRPHRIHERSVARPGRIHPADTIRFPPATPWRWCTGAVPMPIPAQRSRAAIPTGSSTASQSYSTTRRTGEGRSGEDLGRRESLPPHWRASTKSCS